jgi:hypothetical protein
LVISNPGLVLRAMYAALGRLLRRLIILFLDLTLLVLALVVASEAMLIFWPDVAPGFARQAAW